MHHLWHKHLSLLVSASSWCNAQFAAQPRDIAPAEHRKLSANHCKLHPWKSKNNLYSHYWRYGLSCGQIIKFHSSTESSLIFVTFLICSWANCLLLCFNSVWVLGVFDLQTAWSKGELVGGVRGQWSVIVPGSPKTPCWLHGCYSMKTDLSLRDYTPSVFQKQQLNMTGMVNLWDLDRTWWGLYVHKVVCGVAAFCL